MRFVAAASACMFALFAAPPDARADARDDALAAHHALVSAPTRRDREIAQLRLARSLEALRLHQVAFGIFSEIADHPDHAGYPSTLSELVQLATELPDAADVDERVARYDAAAVEVLQHGEPGRYALAQYMRGRDAYRNMRFDDAIRLLSHVAPKTQPFAKAQIYVGLAHVQMRRAAPAVRAFKRAAAAVDDDDADEDRLRDLALLSIARTYYSAGEPKVALDYYADVDPSSEYWTDVMLEQGWAYFAVGDHARALGNVHMRSLEDESADADVLRAFVYLANCRWDDAASIAARVHETYRPMRTAVAKIAFDDDDAFYRFAREVRDGKTSLDGRVRRFVEHALSDRELLRHLQYVQVIDDERRRFERMPPSFVASTLGGEVKDALVLARDIAVRNAGSLARARLRRAVAELDERLGEDAGVLAAAFAAKNGRLDPRAVPFRVPAGASERNVVRGDDEHVIWPWTGELWADELGTYRQSIRSKCR